jgi:hypothetical protein
MPLSIGVSTLLNQLVRQELQGKGKGRENEALYFHLDCRMSHHTNNESYNESRGLHLLYQVNPGYTYINVFGAVTESPFERYREIKEWRHLATHDSCWRDVGIFQEVYFGMAEAINAKLKAANKKTIAPKDMHEWNGFGLTDHLFQWVPVRVTKDPTCEQNYRKLVELL